jgi:hypothetical protein
VTALGERNGVIMDHQIPLELLNVKVHVSSVGTAQDAIELLQKLGWLKYFTYIHALESTERHDFMVHKVLKGEEDAIPHELTEIVSSKRKDNGFKLPFVEEYFMNPTINGVKKIGPGTGRRIGKQVCIFVDDDFNQTANIETEFGSKTERGHQFVPFWISGEKDNNKPKEAFHKGEFKLQEGFENFNVHKVAQLLTTVRSVIDQHDPVAEAMCRFMFQSGKEKCLDEKGRQSADGRLKTLHAGQELANLSACVLYAAEFGVDPWQN